jgi:hypothetical protein
LNIFAGILKNDNMKTSLLSILGALILLCSCQKEYSLNDPSGTGSGTGGTGGGGSAVTGDFRAKIGGVQWVANQAASAVRNNGIINISGLSTDGQFVTMTLMDSGVHVYTLNDVVMNAGAYTPNQSQTTIAYTSNSSNDPALAGGSCTITSIDAVNHKMSGTFSFKVYRQTDNTSKSITEGSFTNITYTTTSGIPPAAATDTFRVKMDGVDWTSYSITATNINMTGFNKIAITSTYDANNTKNMGLTFDNTIVPGSYVFDLFDVVGQYNPTSSVTNPNPYAGSGGNLTILEHNTTTHRIRGNFNFVAAPLLGTGAPVSFTAGYFSVHYP